MANKCNGQIYCVKKYKKSRLMKTRGFWSHFRRMITGCYHDVSDEHLQSYIDEACFH